MLAVAGQAMPLFWLGIMLIIILAVRLKALPASGYGTWQHFVMPSFCLGAFLAPVTMRLVRSGVIEVMNMEYIKTARAKGVAEHVVVAKHAFRNACIPVITVLGLQFGQLLGGAIVTETVFAWPGVATLTVESIRNQDFPVVQCAVVMLALIIVAVNLLVDPDHLASSIAYPGGRASSTESSALRGAHLPGRGGRATGDAWRSSGDWWPPWSCWPSACGDHGAFPAAGWRTSSKSTSGRRHPPGVDGGRPRHAPGTDQTGARSPLRASSTAAVPVIGVSAVLISATLGVLRG
jgi:ABC-type dipeptide/oligopeptide/nickel transport system permease subunit